LKTKKKISKVKFQAEFFWAVTSWSIVLGYQRFRGQC